MSLVEAQPDRTAVYGPVCTVVWEGRRREASPYPDHSLVEILVSLLPLFVVGYAGIDWLRGRNELNVFQVIVMVQATLATLIDVVIFTWFSLRLNKLSIQAVETHAHRS